jgi:hypothetical protein
MVIDEDTGKLLGEVTGILGAHNGRECRTRIRYLRQ